MSKINNVFTPLGASNHSDGEREKNDYYATEPKATRFLLDIETFNRDFPILEPFCGEGHISEVLKENGYLVKSSDLIDRGYGDSGVDFFKQWTEWHGDIISNPPYKIATESIEHALNIIKDGSKVAMFLKIQFLESKKRKKLFEKHPPKTVWVSSSRLNCAKNGDFEKYKDNNAVFYCWYIWEKGFTGAPEIKWFN